MANFDSYKFLLLDNDWHMLLEQNRLNEYLARFYSISAQHETFSCGIYNVVNAEGFNIIGGSNDPEWRSIPFEDFIDIRKEFGLEIQDKFDNLFEMIQNEKYDCYEGGQYIIHIPRYQFRIIGPKIQYSFATNSINNYESYFIKTIDNDYELNFNNTVKISNDNLSKIIETWAPFVSLLLSESKYA